MEVLTANHLTECARVYIFINQEGADFLVINCLFCNVEYDHWSKFYNHLQNHHLQKPQVQQQSSGRSTETEEETDINTGYLDKKCQSRKRKKSLKCDIENEYLVGCRVGKERESNSLVDIKEKEHMKRNNRCHDTDSHCDMRNKSLKPISNCFFRLSTTDSKIMLKFIDLLRNQPFQWDHKHFNFPNKDKRLESTLHLAKQLKENFNLNITPQGTRTSVLTLIRWFEGEYIRLLNCQQSDFEFVCTHIEYFKKLLQFLPIEHLKPMSCNECSKRFKSEHLLLAHKYKHHNGEVPLRCRYCGHGFIHQSLHKMHENRHIKIHIWPCNTCSYQATSKSDYIKHLITHSPHQPYKCTLCNLAYKTKTNLNVHMKSHSLPQYECEYCKKKFYEKYRYKRHIWSHEDSESSNKSVDNFTCELCGRRFTSNKTLIKHKLVHVQENYKVRSSTGEDQKLNVIVYFCYYCTLEFVHKKAYETHMDLKHKNNLY